MITLDETSKIVPPYNSVRKAEELIRKFYADHKNRTFSKDDIISTTGTSATSSLLNRTIRDLKKYGLLDENEGTYKISKQGINLALSDNPEEIADILKDCFDKIECFNAVLLVKPFAQWSTQSLFKYLIKETNIFERPAKEFVSTFFDSINYLSTLGTVLGQPTTQSENITPQVVAINNQDVKTEPQPNNHIQTKTTGNEQHGFYMSYPIGSGKVELTLTKQIDDHTSEELIEIKEVLEFFVKKINKKIGA